MVSEAETPGAGAPGAGLAGSDGMGRTAGLAIGPLGRRAVCPSIPWLS